MKKLINFYIDLRYFILMENLNDPQVIFNMFMGLMVTLCILLISICACEIENNKSENRFEEEGERDDEYENDSVSNPSSEGSDQSDISEEPTSILFKAFSLLTKKQLLKITGNKYKHENKDVLIVFAINNFIFKTIQSNEKLPLLVKNFIKDNKNQMLDETLESYGLEVKNKIEEKIESIE